MIAYDRDEDGERLMGEGMECFRIQFPKGMDANECALKVTPAPKSLGLLVRQAVSLGKRKAPPARPTVPPGTAVQNLHDK